MKDEDSSETEKIIYHGNRGYVAPERFTGVITKKLDTFSFGVVILELVTGLAVIDRSRNFYADLVIIFYFFLIVFNQLFFIFIFYRKRLY